MDKNASKNEKIATARKGIGVIKHLAPYLPRDQRAPTAHPQRTHSAPTAHPQRTFQPQISVR